MNPFYSNLLTLVYSIKNIYLVRAWYRIVLTSGRKYIFNFFTLLQWCLNSLFKTAFICIISHLWIDLIYYSSHWRRNAAIFIIMICLLAGAQQVRAGGTILSWRGAVRLRRLRWQVVHLWRQVWRHQTRTRLTGSQGRGLRRRVVTTEW